MTDFAQILQEAGGAQAPPEQAARLRTALAAEMARGTGELGLPRSGYDIPVTVAVADGLAVTPAPVTLRADPAAAAERAWLLVAATIGALVAAGGQTLDAAAWEDHLVLTAAGADGDLAALALEEQLEGIDRLRARALRLPEHLVAPTDARMPLNTAFATAERAARLGARPADAQAVDDLEDIDPAHPDIPLRPHEDPDPALRAARRILQRLRGMGKWGGYHTEFAHLARGFPGHERALALAVGEALLAAGLLAEKRSVGQRHVFLDPGRAAEIHALVDRGVAPAGLVLP